MGKVVDASDATFDEITGTGWVLVDFWAPWCGPCKMVAPILEQIAEEREITIAKVNTDENPNTPGRFGVRGIPTLVLFNEGQLADQRTGAASKINLDSWLDTQGVDLQEPEPEEETKSSTVIQNITYNIQDSAIAGDINTNLDVKEDE